MAAAFSTFVALFSHILAGGAVPGPLGVIAPLILSAATCVLLANVRWSPVRLTLSVAASQLLFHCLFVLGAPGSTSAPTPEGHSGHGVDTVSMLLDSSTIPPMNPAHSEIGMWLGHLSAALVTIAVLHRGETVMARIAAFTQFLLLRFTRTTLDVTAIPFRPLRGPDSFIATTLPLSMGVFPSTLSRRGPPPVF